MKGGRFLFLLLALTACKPQAAPTPNLDRQIAGAVAATLTAIPTGTACPISTLLPSPTPLALRGLFCEYGFCIGHPEHLTPFDLNAAAPEIRIPSAYAGGKIVAYNTDAFILIIWQTEISDLQYMLGAVAEAANGTLTGIMDIRLVGPYNIFYQPVQPPPDSTLSYGSAAAWECGERAFAWLAYTAQDGSAPALFDQALSRFTCGK